MVKNILTFVLLLATQLIIAQTGLYNSGNIVITGNAQIHISGSSNGNYTNTGSGTIDIAGILKLEGNWENNGSNNVFTNTNTDGEIIFCGITTQTIGGSGPYTNFEKLTVNTGATVNLLAGKAATIEGALTVNGNLTLKTPNNATSAGSLITKNTIEGNGNITVERYFTLDNRHQFVSTPMNNSTSDLFTKGTPAGTFNPNFKRYNETYNAATNPTGTGYSFWTNATYGFQTAWEKNHGGSTGAAQAMSIGQGYSTYNIADFTVLFSTDATQPNDLNTGDKQINITYTFNDANSGYFDGWNLLGNPYPSAIDWDLLSAANAGKTDGFVYYWDGSAQNYKAYSTNPYNDGSYYINGGSKYIPAMQAFFVKAVSSNTFNFVNSSRVHSLQNMWKTHENNQNTSNIEFLKLSVSYNNLTDETVIRKMENANEYYDFTIDGLKSFSTAENIPQISSFSAEQIPLCINSVSNNSDNKIRLSVIAKKEGNYTFGISDINLQKTNAFFEDIENNISIPVDNNFIYKTILTQGEINNRFFIVFGKLTTGTADPSNNASLKIYSYDKTIYVENNDFKNKLVEIEIFTIFGAEIYNTKSYTSKTSINLNIASGTYLVKAKTKNNIETQKVIVN